MTRRGLIAFAILAGLALPVAGDGDWVAALRADVQRCWLPPEAPETVTVAFRMAPDGTVIDDSLQSIPREMEQTESFMAASRAILRCSRIGFDLPADQFDRWKEIEMTFDPGRGLGAVK